MECQLVDFMEIYDQLEDLDSINVDGVTVVAWWGIVEADNPRQYNWSGYEVLLKMLEDRNLKLQVVMAFHEYGGKDVYIPLPKWIKEIGEENPDIYFTDRDGRRNPETLTWGIDEERVLRGRTALEVYVEFMKSFRIEFDEFFKNGVITKIEVGLGACGELRYPSYPAKHGWEYPGIGEFQCYDKYLKKSLEKAAESRAWSSPPDDAGCYNSQPQDTGLFCDGGGYQTAYGSFFLNWYSKCLIDHADRVLAMAKLVFSKRTPIAAKLSGIPWWYKSDSHAAELTAGYYNTATREGYAPIASMLKKNKTALNFTCAELEGFPEAMADHEGLVSQVLNAAWDAGIPVASESALPCHDRQGYNKILELAKPRNDPGDGHLSAFTYHWLNDDLFEKENFREFELFVKRMHGVKR
ncbi:beta-amylase 2, chloroplastic-like isoform X2 [Bidens hawaiensis]|uniref:beta-amylase 2, chloroplastic-like isoform X2 n=1 Tax=Bidens hawaiensis TaxID=980011 RepID=UPI004049FF88